MARRRSRRGQASWSAWFKLFKLSLYLLAVGAAAFYAYEVGQRLALEEVAGLRQEIDRLAAAETAHKADVTKLETELGETRHRAEESEARLEQLALSDEMQTLLRLIRAKLASGLDAKRLAFVIQQAERPRRCGEATTKRFMVKTAKFAGASTWVRFADLITITGEGIGGGNGAEQWFDPEKPVTMKFTAQGGKEMVVEGKLPLQHSMVVKNGEFRFTVVPGARGFVEVTGDRCEYRG